MTISGDGWRLRLRPGAISLIADHLGITRPALQRRLGISESTFARIDRGDTDPSAKTVAAILATSELPFDELFVIEAEDEDSA